MPYPQRAPGADFGIEHDTTVFPQSRNCKGGLELEDLFAALAMAALVLTKAPLSADDHAAICKEAWQIGREMCDSYPLRPAAPVSPAASKTAAGPRGHYPAAGPPADDDMINLGPEVDG